MTEREQRIDDLLATAVTHLLASAAKATCLRQLHHYRWVGDDYWRSAVALGEQLAIVGNAITEAHTMLLADQAAILHLAQQQAQQDQEGWLN